MRWNSILTAAAVWLAGCSTSGGAGDRAETGEATYASSAGTATGAVGTDTEVDENDAGDDTSGWATTDSDGSSGSGTGDGPSNESYRGCPHRLPAGWLFCEDFESVENPAHVFFDYQDDDGAFVLDTEEGASGQRSMRAKYRAGQAAAGFLSLSFGENPVVGDGSRPQYGQGSAFDEVYFRLRIKMEQGWPDHGPHKLARLTAFADADWAEAIVAHLWSHGDDVVLAGDASTCVYGSEVPCRGVGDASALESLGLLLGKTPLFSEEYSGQWHCVEAHVRLNTPGILDGVYEFWVDGALESARADLDWRGQWTEYGINQLSIENFWTGGAPAELRRWIDDIVVSTAPIGCE